MNVYEGNIFHEGMCYYMNRVLYGVATTQPCSKDKTRLAGENAQMGHTYGS